jgi:resuscitation-promoting factor RpfA
MGSHSYAGARHGRPSSPRHAKPMPPSTLQRTAAAGGVAAALMVGESLSFAGTAGAVTPDTWAQLRACESSGNYATNTCNGFYGAYQFDARTWHGLGYSGLASQAPPAVQDQAAQRLYQSRGWEPWPACSAKLGLVDDRSADRSTARPPLAPVVVPSPTPTPAATPAAPVVAVAANAAPLAAPVVTAPVPAAAPPAATPPAATPPAATPQGSVAESVTGWHGQYFTVADVSHDRADVKTWQIKMVAAGYPITIDGRYGPRSAAATTKFEAAHGLDVENPGIVGPQVWAALTK